MTAGRRRWWDGVARIAAADGAAQGGPYWPLAISFVGAQLALWTAFFRIPRHMAAGFLAANLVVAVLIAIQFVRLPRGMPTWLTLAGAANVALQLAATFAEMYWVYGTTQNWSRTLSRWDALYVAVGTLTTAGTGNLSATSELAHRLLTLQMGLDFAILTLVVGLVVHSFTARPWQERSGQDKQE